MLSSNHLSPSIKDNTDFSTISAIPIDILDNNSETVNSISIENLQISLTDGFFCLENENGGKVLNVLKLEDGFKDSISGGLSATQGSNEIQPRTNTIIFNTVPSEKDSFPLHDKIYPEKEISVGKYTCCKCDKISSSLQEFQDHLKWHKFQKKFKCSICSSMYNIENNLKIHVALMHPTESDGRCPICNINLKFQRCASMKAHLMVHQVEEVYSCSDCKNEFDNEDAFKKHVSSENCQTNMLKKDSRLSLKCLHCNLDFKDSKELRNHISEHAKVNRIFMKSKKSNKSKILTEKKFGCSDCGKKFIKQSLLVRHWKIHSGAKPHQCHICERSFAQKATLQIHYTKHSGIKPFSCTLCPAKFAQKGNLRAHIRKTHTINGDNEKTFRCPYCTCIFKRIASLNGHITKLHIDEEISPSSDIDNVLKKLKELEKFSKTSNTDKDSQQNNLLENQAVTNQDSNKPCPTSKVTLTENTQEGSRKYLVNVRKVGDVRWFLCDGCSREFKKPSDLIRHMRIHTKEKPFKCQQCKQAFSLKCTLTSHMSIHAKEHNNRVFKCVVCEHRFMTLKKLNSHIWKHNLESYPKYQCLDCGFLCDDIEIHKKDVTDCKKNQFDLFIKNLMKTTLVQTKKGSLVAKLVKPRSSSTSKYSCDTCNLTFTNQISMTQHLQSHSLIKGYKCFLCFKLFISAKKLQEHLSNHEVVKTYGCKLCDKKYLSWTLLQKHLMVTHNLSKLYSCPYCLKHFKTIDSCKYHCRRVHKITVPEAEINVQTVVSTENTTSNDDNGVIYSLNSKEDNGVLPHVKSQPDDVLLQPLSISIDSTQLTTNENISLEFNNETVYVNLKDLQILDEPNGDIDSTSLQFSVDLNSLNSLKSIENNGTEYEIINDEIVVHEMNKNLKYKSIENNTVGPKDVFGNKKQKLSPNKTGINKNKDELLSVNDNLKSINIFDGNTINPVKSTLDLNDARQIFEDASIICMTCSKLFCSLALFQNHNCENDKISENSNSDTPDSTNTNLIQDDTKNIPPDMDTSTNEKRIDEDTVLFPSECLICKKKIPNKTIYTRHMKTHMNNQIYTCSICKKVITGRPSYIKHLRIAHSDSTGDVRSCKYCGKKFKKPSDLARHLRVHTGEKPFVCKICDRRFSLKSTLSSHETIHDPNHKRFNCSVCNSYFSSKSSLKVHMKIHSGQKLYDCYFCDMKFRTAGHRKSHVLLKHVSKRKKNSVSKKTKIKNVLESVVAEVTNNVKNANKDNNMENRISLINFPEQTLPISQINTPTVITTVDNSLGVTSDQVTIDTISLLQHFQSSGMIITTDESNGESFLINDITLLNLDPSKDNFEIIPMLDSEIQPVAPANNSKSKPKITVKQECHLCHKLYASKDVLRKHIKNVHLKDKFKCSVCKKMFDNEDSLNGHLQEHTTMSVLDSSYDQSQNMDLSLKKGSQCIMNPKDVPSSVLNMKFDLPSTNIEETLFSL